MCPPGVHRAESVKGRRISRSTSIRKLKPIRLDMTPPSPHGWASAKFSLSPPTLPSPLHYLRPRKRCFCQKPAALSTGGDMFLTLSLTLTYRLAYSLVCSCTVMHCHTHTQKQPLIFFVLRLSLPDPLLHFLPSCALLCLCLCDLYTIPTATMTAHHVAHELIVPDSKYKHRSFA